MIILDLGNGDTHHNSRKCIKETIDSIADINGKRDIIIKFQLFQAIGTKEQTRWDVFDWAYDYGHSHGFRVTASVFDFGSAKFLQMYDVPFIKYANSRYLRRIFAFAQEDIISVPDSETFKTYDGDVRVLCCVSKYPAEEIEYRDTFTQFQLSRGISDHTGTVELYYQYRPEIYEVHYALKRWDSEHRKYCLRSRYLIELMEIRNSKCV